MIGGRDRHARVVAQAQELIEVHGERARYVAINFARLTRDGKQVEDGKDAQFWWRVANEVDSIQGNVRLDTATRYLKR
jgi:hypothetical protein